MNMTPTLLAPAGRSTDLGMIGARRLIAVQTVDIARLTTHAVPVVPGSFVAVTGQGPKADSNGSGKTTFLSAVSLLHCESQWRLNHDGRHATGLLFKPESAGVPVSAGGADHGYVIGVFAAPPGEKAPDPITVWIRISRNPNDHYVLARYTSGLHVLHGESDQERADQADARWEELPPKSECGSRSMAQRLYGSAPRCLAYLDTSIRPSVPSLLSQQMTQMSPALIGEALIALTGRDHLLDAEVKGRRTHAEHTELLATRERNDLIDRSTEAEQLAELQRREHARNDLADMNAAWEKYLALALIEKTDQHAEKKLALSEVDVRLEEATAALNSKKRELQSLSLRTDHAQLAAGAKRERERLGGLRTSLEKEIGKLDGRLEAHIAARETLRPLAEGNDGRPEEEHAGIVLELESVEAKRRTERDQAEVDHTEAVARLEAARAGREGLAGHALALLSREDDVIPAVSVLDVVAVDEARRAEWEPRLWRYRDAVVVAPADEQRALDRLSTLPGCTVVLADGALEAPAVTPAPEGVESAVALSGFLHGLKARYEFAPSPDRVHDGQLTEATLGGFDEPFTGRAVRVALAQAEVERALARFEDAVRAFGVAEQETIRARGLLAAAQAAARLADLLEQIADTEREIGDAQRNRESLVQRWQEADEAYTEAKSALDLHESKLEQLKNEVQTLQNERGAIEGERGRTEQALERVDLVSWSLAWGAPYEAAIRLVGEVPEGASRPAAANLRADAIGAFQAALNLLTVDAEHVPASLEQVMKNKETSVSVFAQEPPDRQMFATHTRPLRDYLDSSSETDTVVRDRIEKTRLKRSDEISAMRTEQENLRLDLLKQQKMVEGSVERGLQAIGKRLNELDQRRNGYGARLDIEIVRPAGPNDAWEWRVTPKWRRSPAGGFVSYREAANGAQVKVYAIQLVLAALLADHSVPGRLLILDELGNSLGDTNRKDVLSALHRVAQDEGVTILGTCQDSVIFDAADVCGEILWFYHASATDPYNQPTRAWGFDPERGRVELVAPWLEEGRPLD